MIGKWQTLLTVPLCLAGAAPAPASAPAGAVIALTRSVEDGKPVLIAKVTQADRPVAGVTVAFFLSRTFGEIALGRDSTLDDGTAAVGLPDSLPADAEGRLNIRTELLAPEQYQGQTARFALAAARPEAVNVGDLPRALWSRHAPVALIATLGVLLGGVWLTYAIVVGLIVKIAKAAPPP